MHEHTAGRATLAVLGAGPKGLAIAAKRAALARTGWDVPDLLVVDGAGIAAHWSGAAGYTDGRQLLSTEPEKDVGFPYAHSWGADSERVSHQMGHWSWQRYLVQQQGFADWVDRGRPRPTHRQWSRYLRWVGGEIPVQPILAEVDGIDLADGRWRLTTRTPAGERLGLDCDGLVVTGPGTPIRLPGQPDSHPRILDGRSFWAREDALADTGPVEVCVIGNGETAGSVTTALLGLLPEGSVVELVSDHGVLYTRGESFAENRFYSDPDAAGWQQLAERHRREFLKRTDRGVFSVQVQEVLDRAEAVRTLAGRVVRLEPVEAKVIVEVEHEQARERLAFDWVVVAVGFDPLWFAPLLGEHARAALADAAGGGPHRLPSSTALERAIGHDLAVTGLAPSSTCRFWPVSPRDPGSRTCPALACSPIACSVPTPARRVPSSSRRPTRPPPPAVRDEPAGWRCGPRAACRNGGISTHRYPRPVRCRASCRSWQSRRATIRPPRTVNTL